MVFHFYPIFYYLNSIQLIIGNFGLSVDQSKAQMGMWAILAAPLFMSNDLRTIRPEFEEILLNRCEVAMKYVVGCKYKFEEYLFVIGSLTPLISSTGRSLP